MPNTGQELEALLYDWHNDHSLQAQRDDVAYWIGLATSAEQVLVLGAGTGRVAAPLAGHPARTTTALDLSRARLCRIPVIPGLGTVCGDMRWLPFRHNRFDMVIAPYSAFQLLRTPEDRALTLAEAARVLRPGGLLYIDVSGNFDTCTPANWHIVLREHCHAVGRTVLEWERRSLRLDHVLIEQSFRTADDKVLALMEERYAFLGALDLDAALQQTGFEVVAVDRGYGQGHQRHRHIYHARHRG